MTQKVAVVTGGASGIGRATVEIFLEQGLSVLAADLNEANGEQLLSDLPDAVDAGRLKFARANVAEEDDIVGMFDAALDGFGRVDAVVNNAGIGGAFGPTEEVEVEDWDYTFHVLTRGVWLGVKHGVRAIRKHGEGGAIVNIASIAGVNAGGGPAAYSAAKSAVMNFTRSAGVEYAPERIRVNAICPGYIHTPLAHSGGPGVDLTGIQPWPDPGQPRDLAEVVVFLCEDRARFINATEIIVDGGLNSTGVRLGEVPNAPIAKGVVGVNKGTTGERSVVRRRLEGKE